MKTIAVSVIICLSTDITYGHEKTIVTPINFIDGKYEVQNNNILISEGYSCIVLNLKSKIDYWVVPPKSWIEDYCRGFAVKSQSQIYKLYKNNGSSPKIDNNCINLSSLNCGYKNLIISSS